jgi:hypothetical protein
MSKKTTDDYCHLNNPRSGAALTIKKSDISWIESGVTEGIFRMKVHMAGGGGIALMNGTRRGNGALIDISVKLGMKFCYMDATDSGVAKLIEEGDHDFVGWYDMENQVHRRHIELCIANRKRKREEEK